MPVLTIKTNVEGSKVPAGFHEEATALLSKTVKKPEEVRNSVQESNRVSSGQPFTLFGLG